MIAFIFGLILGACILAIILWVRYERHEFLHDTCARCGHSLEDWGPPRVGSL